MTVTTADSVAARATELFDETLSRLERYLQIPAISCEPEHSGDVRRLAGCIREDLEQLGFEATLHEITGALPLVSASRRVDPSLPTLLVYGHFDLQPVRGETWSTPPHQPTRAGERLFARGAADDMGGWVSHLAAIRAWLEVAGELPLNLKLIIEGEEEIGSPNLERYMDALPDAFEADVMVLTDCENPSTDIPGLTVSLRGLYEVELVCEALQSDVHSGLWGNMVPDPANALVKLLARLVDEDTRLNQGRVEVPQAWRQDAWAVPLNDDTISVGARLLEGLRPLPEHGAPPAEWLWRQPAVTILSTTLPRPEEQKNAVRQRASATLSLRIAPGQTKDELKELVEKRVLTDPPGGVRVSLVEKPGGAESWLYEPSGPAFEAADRAYVKAWGRPLLPIGIGGSIPFVALFGRRFAQLPLILNGVMDPQTGAHGPDESLHLGVFKKAILANVHLYDELAQTPGIKR